PDVARKAGKGSGQPSALADEIASRNAQRFTWLHGDGFVAGQLAGTDFGPAQILQHGDFTPRPKRCGAHARKRRPLRVVRAVRKIEAEDIRARCNQRVEHAVRIARRPDGRNYFRLSHRNGSSFLVRGSSFAFVVRRSSFVERRTSNDEPEPRTTNEEPRTTWLEY